MGRKKACPDPNHGQVIYDDGTGYPDYGPCGTCGEEVPVDG